MDFKEVTKTEIKFMNEEEYYAWYNVKDMLGDLIAFESSNGRPMGALCLNAETALNAMNIIENKNLIATKPEEDEKEVYTHEEAFDELFEDEEEPTVYKVYMENYVDEIRPPKYEYIGGSADLDEAIKLGLDYVRGEGWNVEYERYFNDENGKGMNIDYGAWDSYIWITPAPPESWWHSWNGEKGEED